MSALDLLERALAYAGGALRAVPPSGAGVPTPCRGWDLDRLLAHLEDALDAFDEAAAGAVRLDPGSPPGLGGRSCRLERKAAALLRAWRGGAPTDVLVGERQLAAEVLVPAAALEIAVHGWDVAQAVGGPGLDPGLARDLAPAAALLVPAGAARAGRFDPPPPGMRGPGDADRPADAPARLLTWLGRRQAVGSVTTNRAPVPGVPS